MKTTVKELSWLSIIPIGSHCQASWTSAWVNAMSLYGLPTVRTLRVEDLKDDDGVKDGLSIILADLESDMDLNGIQEALVGMNGLKLVFAASGAGGKGQGTISGADAVFGFENEKEMMDAALYFLLPLYVPSPIGLCPEDVLGAFREKGLGKYRKVEVESVRLDNFKWTLPEHKRAYISLAVPTSLSLKDVNRSLEKTEGIETDKMVLGVVWLEGVENIRMNCFAI